MLAEFALTPSIFDEDAHPDPGLWREQLRELGGSMFPKVSAWPVMVANLYAGSWHNVALQIATNIKDDKARVLCQGILEKATRTLVPRPARLDWPQDELMWAREAIDAHGVEPIDRIVATAAAHKALIGECKFIRSIDEVHEGGFWHDISADASPAMKIVDQVRALRKLCIHSEFLCLITPSIFGGGDDETDFALEFIKSAANRPTGFAPGEIEIHTEGPDGHPGSAEFAARLANRASAISRCIKAVLCRGQQVKLIVWPKLLDRLVVAGVLTKDANGQRIRSPRWGISMSHIARKPDEKRADFFTEWKLLKRDSLGRWFDQYCRAGVTGLLHTETVAG
jgi:hypothetical protein